MLVAGEPKPAQWLAGDPGVVSARPGRPAAWWGAAAHGFGLRRWRPVLASRSCASRAHSGKRRRRSRPLSPLVSHSRRTAGALACTSFVGVSIELGMAGSGAIDVFRRDAGCLTLVRGAATLRQRRRLHRANPLLL